jgi:hypothetical protein
LDRREDPVAIALPDLAAVLPPGATKVIEDELGEIGLGEVLRQFRGDAADTSGWRGDRYALWDVTPGASLLVAITAWDGDAAAAAFARAYSGVMVTKHRLAPHPEGLLLAWAASGRAFVIEQRGRTVVLIERAPAAALDALRAALWATPVLY